MNPVRRNSPAVPATGAQRRTQVDVSVVVPLLNEVRSLPALHAQLQAVMTQTGLTFEIICIDDGSADGSFELLAGLHAQNRHLKVIRLRRNFGQSAAFAAGFDAAGGRVVVTLDGDLQNDPSDIPRLLQKLDEGYDIVSGWRFQRRDPYLSRRLPSIIANWLISTITGVRLHDSGCSLKAYRREVIENINLYGEMHRFIPALASWMGIRVAEIRVNHTARAFGRSKYGLTRILKVVLDLLAVKFLLGYGTRPMHIFGTLGAVCLSVGTLTGVYLTVIKLFMGQALGDRPLLLLVILLVMLGVQLITMGLLGELVVRTYYETQGKPIYIIREVLDAEPAREDPADEDTGG